MTTHSSTNKEAVWGSIVVLVLISIAAIVLFAKSHNLNPTQATSSAQAPAVSAQDWTQGPKDAKVTLIEYGDFQCPACGAYHPMVQQVLSNYGDKILFVFRNFPLPQHQDAWISAQAAEAAGLQGKYWDMNNLLYEKQNDWTSLLPGDARNKIEEYAQSLNLDMSKFGQDIDSAQVKNKIQSDLDGGTRAQIGHTPTFFINGTQIVNPANYDEFKSDLDKALASS